MKSKIDQSYKAGWEILPARMNDIWNSRQRFLNKDEVENELRDFDWGCPDWSKRSAYPESHSELDDEEWKWQFIRRLPLYRTYWFLVMMNKKFENDLEEDPKFKFLKSRVQHFFDLTEFVDPRNTTCPVGEYIPSTISPFIPGERDPKNVALLKALNDIMDSPDLPVATSLKVVTIIDLNRPIDFQVERIKKECKELVEEIPEWQRGRSPRLKKSDRKKWPFYLRMIDAEDQQAKDMEIFRQLISEGEEIVYNADNEAARIAQTRDASRVVMRKAALYL